LTLAKKLRSEDLILKFHARHEVRRARNVLGVIPIWVLGAPAHAFGWVPAVFWIVACSFIVWWTLPIKKVSLVGDSLLISNYWRDIEVPVPQISRIHEDRWNRTSNISLFFDPPTSLGSKVRIVISGFGEDEFDRVVGLLRCAIESHANPG
jgi:hypothetical protein